MTQGLQKRLGRRARSKTELVQVTLPDHDVACLEALARLLDANDAAAADLRGEIESILADEPGNMDHTSSWTTPRH